MKKLILFAFFALTSFWVFAQYPATQTLGSDSTLVVAKGAFKGRIVFHAYPDTLTANSERISQYPHAGIVVGNTLYLRDSTSTQWIDITSSIPQSVADSIFSALNTKVDSIYFSSSPTVDTIRYTKNASSHIVGLIHHPNNGQYYITNVYKKTGTDSVFYVQDSIAIFSFVDSVGNGGRITLTPKSVPYIGADSTFTENNTGLYWDGSNLVAGQNGYYNTTGILLNGGRASVQASGVGITIKTVGISPVDPSKHVSIANSDKNYFDMFANGNQSLSIKSGGSLFPDSADLRNLGLLPKQWDTTFTKVLYLNGVLFTPGSGGGGSGISKFISGWGLTNINDSSARADSVVLKNVFYNKSSADSGLATKADKIHTHDASDITTGVFNTARLGSGAADATKVLYGNNTWDVVPSGGNDSAIVYYNLSVDSSYALAIHSNRSIHLPSDTIRVFGGGVGGGAQLPSDWNATSGVTQILNKPLITNATTSGIIDPLLVTWTGTGLVFDISAGSFVFNNVNHYVNASTVTLTTADATYPRIDAFYVDTLGNTGKITGVPAANPVAPQVTYGQFLLTTVQIDASATTPTNVNLTDIYLENTEWTTSKTGTGTVDFNDATNPYSGSKDIKVSGASAGLSLVFTNPSTIDTANIGDVLRLFFYTSTALTSGYTLQFFSGTNPVSYPLSINAIGFGYNPATLSAYQNISIPFSAFTFTSPQYTTLKITNIGANANPVYWDNIQIQKGLYQFAPTDYSNKVDSVTISAGKQYYWAKGSSHLVGSVGGSSGVQTVTGTTVDNTDPANPVIQQDNSKLDKSDSTLANRITANTINLDLKTDSIYRTPGKDSIQFTIGGRYNAIKDSVGDTYYQIKNPVGFTTVSDSYGAAQGATTADSGFVNRLVSYYGGISSLNFSLGAKGVWYAAKSHLAGINTSTTADNTSGTIWEVGFNDFRLGISQKTFNKFVNCLKSVWVNNFLESWQAANNGTNVTRIGSWAAFPSQTYGGKSASNGSFTSTLNDTITFTTPSASDNIVVGLIGSDGITYTYSDYIVLIDGVQQPPQSNGTENLQYDGILDGGTTPYDNKRGPMALVYSNLTNTIHTIKLVNKSSDTLVVDYFGELVSKEQGTYIPMLIYKIPYATNTAFTSYGGGISNNSVFDTANLKIDSLVAALPNYAIRVANTNAFTNTSSDMYSDSIHKNDQGYRHMAEAMEAVLPINVTPVVIGGRVSTSTLVLKPTTVTGTTGSDIIFKNGGNTEIMRLTNAGSVGIGGVNINPTAQLEIRDNSAITNRGIILAEHNTSLISSYFQFIKSRGTYSAPTAASSGDYLGLTDFKGYVGATNTYQVAARISTIVNGAVTDATFGVPADIRFYTSNGTSFAERWRIDKGGNLSNNSAAGTEAIDITGNLKLNTAGNKIKIAEGTNGSVGQTALVSGVSALSISGLTTSSRAIVSFVAVGGTVTSTWQYKAVCTAGTLTITAIDNTGATNASDTSTLNYFIIN